MTPPQLWHYINSSRSFPLVMVLGCKGDVDVEILNNLTFKALSLPRVLRTQLFFFLIVSVCVLVSPVSTPLVARWNL